MVRAREARSTPYLGFPPNLQELRARKIGRVVVNSSMDRPWSSISAVVCARGNREFVRRYPVATKRALRAILTIGWTLRWRAPRWSPVRCRQGVTKRNFNRPPNPPPPRLSKGGPHSQRKKRGAARRPWREFDPKTPARFIPAVCASRDQVEPLEDHREGAGLALFIRERRGS